MRNDFLKSSVNKKLKYFKKKRNYREFSYKNFILFWSKIIHWPAKLLHGQGVTSRFDISASVWQRPSEPILFG
jgi:hypothetical protein